MIKIDSNIKQIDPPIFFFDRRSTYINLYILACENIDAYKYKAAQIDGRVK